MTDKDVLGMLRVLSLECEQFYTGLVVLNHLSCYFIAFTIPIQLAITCTLSIDSIESIRTFHKRVRLLEEETMRVWVNNEAPGVIRWFAYHLQCVVQGLQLSLNPADPFSLPVDFTYT